MRSQFSLSVMSNSLWTHGLQHARHSYPSPTPEAYSNSCPSTRWRHPTISSSVIPFSSCLQPFPASGSFPMSQFFASGCQSTGVSASASVLPMNIQDWFPLGWTGWISLQSKELSRVFFNTIVQKHQSWDLGISIFIFWMQILTYLFLVVMGTFCPEFSDTWLWRCLPHCAMLTCIHCFLRVLGRSLFISNLENNKTLCKRIPLPFPPTLDYNRTLSLHPSHSPLKQQLWRFPFSEEETEVQKG